MTTQVIYSSPHGLGNAVNDADERLLCLSGLTGLACDERVQFAWRSCAGPDELFGGFKMREWPVIVDGRMARRVEWRWWSYQDGDVALAVQHSDTGFPDEDVVPVAINPKGIETWAEDLHEALLRASMQATHDAFQRRFRELQNDGMVR